jgi:hypothetical protein
MAIRQPVTPGYRYFPTPYPTPDTGNMAFDTGQTLPLFQVQGPGISYKKQLQCVGFAGQQFTNLPTVLYQDIAAGGLISGQIVSQPLSPQASGNNSTG